MTYTFPFTTCEIPQKEGVVAQPFSVSINAITCFIILTFLLSAKTPGVRVLLVCLFLFESLHTFSHAVHLKNKSQMFVVHSFAYVVNAALFYTLYRHFRVFPDASFIAFLIFVVWFDIYALFRLPINFYVSTQIILFMSLLAYFYRSFSREAQRIISYLCFLSIVLSGLFLYEIYNCKAVLEKYNGFPLHTLLEIGQVFFFYFSCKLFTTIDK